MKVTHGILSIAIILFLTGCINVSTRTQPDDLTVKEELTGSDCVPIIFSLGYGTADIEKAKMDGKKLQRDPTEKPFTRFPITKVRRWRSTI